MPKREKEYKVIRDTREQEGYYFKAFGACTGMIDQKLDTGDYAVAGLEDICCIERKGSVEELALNLGQGKDRFFRELDRMEAFPHKFLILEFTADDLIKFPEKSRVPIKNKSAVKVTGRYMLKSLIEFQLYRGINVLFCTDKYNGFLIVSSILKRINEQYGDRRDGDNDDRLS